MCTDLKKDSWVGGGLEDVVGFDGDALADDVATDDNGVDAEGG